MDEVWVGKCAGCGLLCVLYEEVEFVCGKCHGTINPGRAVPPPVAQALGTLFAHELPTTHVLAALARGSAD